MSDAFLGEIRMFGGIYAPANWSSCAGTLLDINNYQALFSLLGTAYGGDGRVSFGLPDMRGRIPVGQGHGPSLSNRIVGMKYGSETHTLTVSQMPAHHHVMQASTNSANTANPTAKVPAAVPEGELFYDDNQAPSGEYGLDTENDGGSQDHPNEMPWLCIKYIICLQGIFPSRN